METLPHTTQTWRFGIFQVDAREGKLLRAGTPLRIREQSFRVLVLLLEHPGELVTRDQLRSALWPSDTFVDFEHGLNTAVMKLREALGDSAETPFYIETVPKRGYRFIAPLEMKPASQGRLADPDPGFLMSADSELNAERSAVGVKPGRRLSRFHLSIGATAFVLVVASTLIFLDVRGWLGRLLTSSPQVHAVAVLPFTNLSGDPAQEYFSDGMTDALITELGRIQGLRVISRQSIMQFKSSRKSMDQIARELKVDAIIEGAVERTKDRIRITVHLAQGNPERQLWAEQYDRDIRDVLAIQGDIARSVTTEIRVKLSPGEMRMIGTSPRVDPEAHSQYLQGLYDFWTSRNPERSINPERAIEHFKKAIEKDQTFAPAYADLAIAYFWLSHIGGPPPKETLPLSRAAASAAMQLDRSLAQAHVAAGLLASSDYNWTEAKEQFNEALRLNPSCAECYRLSSIWFLGQGRTAEAIAQVRQAIELDPLNNVSQNQLGEIAFIDRDYDQAISIFENLHESAWFGSLASAYAAREHFAQAFSALDRCGSSDYCLMTRVYISCQAGRKKDGALILDNLNQAARQRYVYPAVFVLGYTALGDKEQALRWLERAYEEKEPWLFWLKVHPMLDPLRGEPRFQAILRKVYPR